MDTTHDKKPNLKVLSSPGVPSCSPAPGERLFPDELDTDFSPDWPKLFIPAYLILVVAFIVMWFL